MNKETAGITLVLVTMLAVFVAFQPIIPSNAERFSELGVLGPNQTISNYPTNVSIGQVIHLFTYVGDHEGKVTFYQLQIKLGDKGTIVSNATAADAPVLEVFDQVLRDNQSWIYPITLSLNQTGLNQRLIFELWSYNQSSSNFSYLGLWAQLWVNVTSGGSS